MPDFVLNALLDEQEENAGSNEVVVEAAASSSQAPVFIAQSKLTEAQRERIARNRQIALAIQAAFNHTESAPGAVHRINFDEVDGGDFGIKIGAMISPTMGCKPS